MNAKTEVETQVIQTEETKSKGGNLEESLLYKVHKVYCELSFAEIQTTTTTLISCLFQPPPFS